MYIFLFLTTTYFSNLIHFFHLFHPFITFYIDNACVCFVPREIPRYWHRTLFLGCGVQHYQKGSPLVVEEELNSELALTTGRNLVPIVWIMKRSLYLKTTLPLRYSLTFISAVPNEQHILVWSSLCRLKLLAFIVAITTSVTLPPLAT